MPIPDFGAHGALPPFISGCPTDPNARSPYQVTMFDVVDRFCSSPARAQLLKGLNAYRKHLHTGGFTSGSQWIDGSFVENVEIIRRRAPNDIDIVTLFNRPLKYQINADAWVDDFSGKLFQEYFDTKFMRPKFKCDTYPIDLDAGPRALVRNTTYWYGLFSDMREANTKKGIIEIPLAVDAMEFSAIEQKISVKFNV